MPRRATGTSYEREGRHYARVTIEGDRRRSFALDGCRSPAEAEERAAALAGLALALRRAGMVDRAEGVLGEAAPSPAATVRALAERIAAGAYTAPSTAPTIAALAKRWTSGELAREFPDHVRTKKTSEQDANGFRRHVLPHVGDVRIDAFTLEHAERVMKAIPAERTRATRRSVAQLMHRLCAVAVYPLRLIPASPLPKGFLPRLGEQKAKGYLFPDEDRKLLAAPAVPLAWRVTWGVLHREGLRFGEAASLTWSDLDLDRGSITLDANKTGRRGFWALGPGVAAALRAWKAMRSAGPSDRVLVDEDGAPLDAGDDNAERYRKHLRLAGIDRPQLFKSTAERRAIRAHDARASFVTIALSNGRSEAWISTRTGHTSSIMIARYRRQAATAAELDLGDWAPLDAALPEFDSGTGSGTNSRSGDGSDGGASTGSPLVSRSERTARTGTPRRSRDDLNCRDDSTSTPDREDSPGKVATPETSSSSIGDPGAASGAPPAASGGALGLLAAAIAAAVAEGDLEAAREMTATLTRLLAKPAEPGSNVLPLRRVKA